MAAFGYVPVGVDAVYFAKIEAVPDTAQLFVAGDAMPFTNLELVPVLEYRQSNEHLGTASLSDEIKGLQFGTWKASGYIRPNAAGVAPQIGPALKAAYSVESIVGGTSVTYKFSSGTPITLQLCAQYGVGLQLGATMAWVEQIQVDCIGNQEPMITLSGGFSGYYWFFNGATTTATIAAAATTFTLNAASIAKIGGAGAQISFPTDNNTGLGYRVVSADLTTGVVVFTPGLGIQQTGATLVSAFTPTPTYSGTIQGGVGCAQTIDAVSVGFIHDKNTIKTGYHGLKKEATVTRPNRVARGDRDVAGEDQFYWLDETSQMQGQAFNGATHAITTTIGLATAGQHMKVVHPKARYDVAQVKVPQSDEATVTMKRKSRKNAANEDEHQLLFD